MADLEILAMNCDYAECGDLPKIERDGQGYFYLVVPVKDIDKNYTDIGYRIQQPEVDRDTYYWLPTYLDWRSPEDNWRGVRAVLPYAKVSPSCRKQGYLLQLSRILIA